MSLWKRAAGIVGTVSFLSVPLAGAAQAAALAPVPIGEIAPGKMIDVAPLPPELGLEEAGQNLAIAYGSTDGVSGSGAVLVTGALFIPKGKAPAGGWPIVAWMHGTVGIGDSCAPSRNPRTDRDRTYLESWLKEGYAVVATDYQGLGSPGVHPYMNNRAGAYSTLDSVRAVLSGGFGLANKVLVVGQSQGGGAAVATAGYAAGYAPDVDVRGTIATSVPNLAARDTFSVDGDRVYPFTSFLLLAKAQQAQAAQLGSRYDPKAVFTDRAMPLFDQADSLCEPALGTRMVEAGLTPNNSFKSDFWNYHAPMVASNGFPTLRFPAPMFVGTGADDVSTPPAMQKTVVDAACAAGSTIEWHVYPGHGHSAMLSRSFTDSRVFAARVMAGEPIASTCKTAG